MKDETHPRGDKAAGPQLHSELILKLQGKRFLLLRRGRRCVTATFFLHSPLLSLWLRLGKQRSGAGGDPAVVHEEWGWGTGAGGRCLKRLEGSRVWRKGPGWVELKAESGVTWREPGPKRSGGPNLRNPWSPSLTSGECGLNRSPSSAPFHYAAPYLPSSHFLWAVASSPCPFQE